MKTKNAHPEDRSAERLPPKDPSPVAEDLSPEVTTPEEVSGQEPSPDRLIVTGIGASAGGLEALQAFFEALPENLGVAFVVIVHLSPEHPSHLAEILATCTSMPVQQVQSEVLLEGDHVYVIPPGHRLEISDTSVGAFLFEEPRGQRAPIDQFFRSLAEQHGDGFALILSGGGSDGAVGVKAVKERGGLILVQDPKEAAYDSMPRAAIATGVVDVVLPVRELADRLADLTRSKRQVRQRLSLEAPAALDGEDEQLLGRILNHLHARTGHDFSKYKRATVLRRLGRRLQIQRQESLEAYLAFLRQSGEEVQALLNDLLISVTSFFRDPAAFEALQKKVIPQLFEAERANSRIRVWAPGCATGEEAYSIAILLLEEADRRQVRSEIQLFASDLDESALVTARGGSYPAAIEADVSPERLHRFFIKEGDHYRVTKELRDCVLFASHSLLKDTPFSRLDLISCRNLLIYLDRELQAQLFGVFRYALRPGGYLFLGASETAEGRYFRALDRTYHLYQAREGAGQALPPLPDFLLSTPSRRTPTGYEQARPEPLAPTLHRKLLEGLAPPSILVDESRNTLHLSETAGRFLQPPGGPITQDLLQLVRPELQVELRSALYQAFERAEASLSPFIPVRFNGTPRRVALLVQPRQEGEARLALVVFLEGGEVAPSDEFPAPSSPSAEAIPQLQEALQRTQAQMRTMRKEYDATNEELRAANEELMSLNEEYRTAVEELETSKEELQSLNEELETVNSELKHKLNEISLANSDLENLIAATEIGTLFLDLKLRIHRFTPRLSDLFNLTLSDQGRPIGDFSHRLDYDRLEADARQVLENLGQIEREVRSQADRWYLARFRPYRTVDNRIDGVVVTFVDITERKRAEEEIRAARNYAESIVETIHEPLVVLRPDLRVESANPVFYEQFKVQPAQTEGGLIYELGNNQWDTPELRRLLEEVLPDNKVFEDYEVSHNFEGIGERVMLLNGRRLDHVQLILLAIEDITERKQAEEALRRAHAELEERVQERTRELHETNAGLHTEISARKQAEVQLRQLASRLTMAEQEERRRISQILHDELQQLLYGIQLTLEFVRDKLQPEQQEELVNYTAQAAIWLQDAITMTRRLTVDLSPPVLKGEGLTEALGWLVSQMAEVHNFQVKVEAEHPFSIAEADMRVLLFQSVRELLFNVVKHGETNRATVILAEEAGQLVIQVKDEGRGFEVAAVEAKPEGGFGLFSIRERLAQFGGRLEIASRPGEGAQITLYTPLKLKQSQDGDN